MGRQRTIFYFINEKTESFYVFLDDVKAKREAERMNCMLDYKTLNNFYGTVFIAYKKIKGEMRYSIHATWKTAKENKKYGYTIKKFVLTPYEDYATKKEQYWSGR